MSDDIEFKEEILKNIRNFEDNLIRKINTKIIELNSDYKKFHENLNNLSENNKQIINSLISKNVNLEKISSLEQFRNKVDSIIITHEIRINNNIEEISAIKQKYDKALIENLLVPGYVGPSCQFRNIGDFIVYNINQISKIKSEKDIIKNSFKDLRIKTDSSIKTVLSLNESLIRRCNDYADNRISELKKLLYEKFDYMNIKEKEINEMIHNFNEEQEKIKNKNINFGKELKEEILSEINIKINENTKKQEEKIYDSINQNNNFLENYFDNKIKNIKENILDIQNKLNNIYNRKEFPLNNRFIPQRNNKNNVPMMTSLTQRELPNLNSFNKEEKKINKNEINDNYIENKSYSNLHSEEKEIYRTNKTFSNFNNLDKKKDEQILNDMYLGSEKINKKSEINEKYNKFNEINKSNLGEKSAEKSNVIFKDKEYSDLILKHKNSKVLIFNYEHKKYNNKLIPKSKFNIKKESNKDEFIKKFSNLKTLKLDNIKDSEVIDCGTGEDKSLRNIFDILQTPKILDKRILSNKKIKMKYSKSPNPKNRINIKNELNKSETDINHFLIKYSKNLSPQLKKNELKFKTLDNWKKNSKNWKSERNINLNKDRADGYNIVNLELKTNNSLNNGAKILACKKIMNNHIKKNEYPNSFENLYNAQVIKNK